MTTKTFNDAYGVLQRHSETLREQREPNIDDLLSIVTESVGAYKVCKERIDAVEKALEKALSDTGTPMKEAPRKTRLAPPQAPVPAQPRPPSGFDDMDDDIPF